MRCSVVTSGVSKGCFAAVFVIAKLKMGSNEVHVFAAEIVIEARLKSLRNGFSRYTAPGMWSAFE